MGQNHSCKCNYENDQKKSSELKLEKKINEPNENETKSHSPLQETKEFKTKSSRVVNKTLEVSSLLIKQIINSNDGFNIAPCPNPISSRVEENLFLKYKKPIQENGIIIEERLSPNNLSNLVHSNNFKINSSINDSKSSKSSVPNIKKDFKKLNLVSAHKNTKKFVESLSFSQLNCNTTNRAPLEIINEYHREYSVEALFELTPPKIINTFPPKIENNLFFLDDFKSALQPIYNQQPSGDHKTLIEVNPIRKIKKNSPINYDQIRKCMLSCSGLKTVRQTSQESLEKTQNYSNSSGFLKKNGNSNLLGSDESETIKNMITQKKDTSDKKKDRTFDDRLKDINIFSLFPKEKLLNFNQEDVLMQGELLKYSVPEVYFASPYSSKFCVLYRSEFKYYKSKEAFFRLGQPLYIISVLSINSCLYLKEEKDKFNKIIHQFSLDINQVHKPEVWIDKQRKFHKKHVNEDKFDSVVKGSETNKVNDKKKDEKRAKKMNLLTSSKKIKEDLRSTNDQESNNTSLIFAGEEEKVVKWMKIFQFVLENK